MDIVQKDIYEEMILKSRSIYITNNITMENMIEAKLLFDRYRMLSNKAPIHIYINSPGGEVNAAFMLVNDIVLHDVPVITYNIGEADSAASFIFISGNTRIMYPHSSIMMHSVRANPYGTTTNIKQYTSFLHKLDEYIIKFIKTHTLLDDETIHDIVVNNKEHYWVGDEAIEYGLADQLYLGTDFVEPICSDRSEFHFAYLIDEEKESGDNNRANKLREEYYNVSIKRHSKIKKRNTKKDK